MKLDKVMGNELTGGWVEIENGVPTTTSVRIAEVFGKRHGDVIRSIERQVLPTVSREFNERNFALVNYRDAKGEYRPMYRLTRDGFTMVVMGYTGPAAMQFKESYIKAFNQLEATLRRTAPPLTNDEIIDKAAMRVTTKLFPQFMKTVAPTMAKSIIEQVRSLPQGETLLAPPTEPETAATAPEPTAPIQDMPLSDLPSMLTVADVKNYLGIGQRQAYELVHSKDFPAFKVSGVIRIEKRKFIAWLDTVALNPV